MFKDYDFVTFVDCLHDMGDPKGAAALGAQAGEARLREIALGGGFMRFRRATQTPFNLILEAKP